MSRYRLTPMPLRRVAATLLVAAAGAGVAGCAGAASTSGTSADDFPAEQRPIVTAVNDFADDASTRDYDAMCRDDLTTQLVDKLTASRDTTACPDQLDRSLKEVGSFDLAVQEGGVQVSGDTARVRVISDLGDEDRTDVITLQRQSGDWRVAAL